MNAARPLVSVVMPLHNAGPFVREAVGSVLAQTYRDFELLIVDDASTDDGAAVVASFQDARIRLVREPEQRGPAAARNRALAEASGNFIAFFDSDDVALPTWLAESIDFLAAHADCDIVGAWVEIIDEHGAPTGAINGYRDRPEKLASVMLFTNCLPTSTLVMRARCLEGRSFDPTVTLASDYDLWVRLVTSHQACVLQKVLARYRAHPQSITHRKSAAAEECLGRIARFQLERLGVTPTAEELSLHLRLHQLTFGTSRETVRVAESWLLRLDEANAGTAVYPQQPFHETLGERWFATCHSACGNGLWTWRRFHRSRLAGWFAPSQQQRRSLFYLCLRGALKRLFLPSTGSAATNAIPNR